MYIRIQLLVISHLLYWEKPKRKKKKKKWKIKPTAS
jgi:hypothetical protein